MRNKTNHTPLTRGSRLTDAKLLLIITICVFVVMYLCAVLTSPSARSPRSCA